MRSFRITGFLAFCFLLSALVSQAQEKDKSKAKPKERKYPHVNVATVYEVDLKWPQRPADMQWGAVPGIAVDAKDNVYVFTRAKHPVQVYDKTGKFLRDWGKDIGSGSAHHLKIDRDGNVWISDIVHHVVEKYTPEGKLLMTLGTKGVAGRDQTHFYMPTDMAIASNGDIFVSDGYGNARVVHFTKDGKYVNEWGDLGSGPGQFSIPHAIAINSKDQVFVADRNNARIQVFDTKGKYIEEWRNLIVPWGFHVTKNDDLWVCGSSVAQWRKEDSNLGVPPKDQIFMRFNPTGKLVQLFAIPKGIDGLERRGEVNWVHALAFDSEGNLYVGDIIGRNAQKFVVRTPKK
jgi:streptogramin lyase